MQIVRVLAAVAVKDIEAAIGWYSKLFGKSFDERPMTEAAEWFLSGQGGVQLVLDAERAGTSLATIGIADIAAYQTELKARGIDGDLSPEGQGPFRLMQLPDPDGNIITFAQDQR